MKQLNIELMLTYGCNFRCAYCYEKNLEYENMYIDSRVVNKLLRYVDWYLGSDPTKSVRISFWGGEPTLQTDIIKRITHVYQRDPRVSFLTITNGYKIDQYTRYVGENICLFDYRLFTQISYDFVCQNRRKLASGKDTKDEVKKTIQTYAHGDLPFSLKSTILLEDLPKIDSYYEEFLEMKSQIPGVDLTITPDTTMTWNSADEEFEELLKKTHESMKKLIRTAVKNKEKHFNFLISSRSMCTAGNNFFGVDINGDIYPCHGVIYVPNKEKYRRGNINELRSFDFPFDVFEQPKKCQNCTESFCYRCNAHNLLFTNKETLKDQWLDHGCNKFQCRLYHELSNFQRAYQKITTGNY